MLTKVTILSMTLRSRAHLYEFIILLTHVYAVTLQTLNVWIRKGNMFVLRQWTQKGESSGV